jgi:hypothetical protein
MSEQLVRLAAFGASHPSQYLFDTGSGRYALRSYPTVREAHERCCGFGAERRVGLVRRERVFVAIFTGDPAHLTIRVGQQGLVAREGEILASCRSVFPMARRLSVSTSGQSPIAATFWYSGLNWEQDPEGEDIFLHIADVAGAALSTRRFLYFWSANAGGRDISTQAFSDELEAYVARPG